MCSKCNIQFSSYLGLKCHMRVTHQLKQSETKPCAYCKKEISVSGMGGHLSKYHGISKSGVLCVRCNIRNNKIFKTKEDYEKHLETEHSKDFTCDKCNIEFNELVLFNDHLKNCLEKSQELSCKSCPSVTELDPTTGEPTGKLQHYY